jgi:hypothetical protein
MSEVINMTEGLIKHKQPTFHYLLTSCFNWQTGSDLHALIKRFDSLGDIYWVWYVPGDDATTKYEINFYQPQVEGSFVLMEHNPAEKKAKAKR